MDKSHWSWLRVVPLMIGLMSGLLSIVREFLLFSYPEKVQERPLFWASLRIAFVISAVIAWWLEHTARNRAEAKIKDEKPKIMFGLLGDIDWSNLESWNEWVFTLTNYGKRKAIHVHIDPIESLGGAFTLSFGQLDLLLPDGHYQCIGHEVDDGEKKTALFKRSLWNFFHNAPLEKKNIEFDVIVRYRDEIDVSEEKQKVVRMLFNADTKRVSIDPN